MAFPSNLNELRAAGYKHVGEGECKSCGEDIEWWETPKGKHIPMDHGTARAHWSTCPEADQHRTSGERHGKPTTSKITTATLDMDWLKKQAAGCHCVVCKKITGR